MKERQFIHLDFEPPGVKTVVRFVDALKGLDDRPLPLDDRRKLLKIDDFGVQITEPFVHSDGRQIIIVESIYAFGTKVTKHLSVADGSVNAENALGAVSHESTERVHTADELPRRLLEAVVPGVDFSTATTVYAHNSDPGNVSDLSDSEVDQLTLEIHDAIGRGI